MFFDSSIKERGLNMEQKAFYQRVLIPIGIVMLLMILSINIYNISPKIGLGHPDLQGRGHYEGKVLSVSGHSCGLGGKDDIHGRMHLFRMGTGLLVL